MCGARTGISWYVSPNTAAPPTPHRKQSRQALLVLECVCAIDLIIHNVFINAMICAFTQEIMAKLITWIAIHPIGKVQKCSSCPKTRNGYMLPVWIWCQLGDLVDV